MDEKTTKKGVLAFLNTEQDGQRCLLWTSAIAISLIVLPRILKALWMSAQQAELASWQIGGCALISYIAGAVCAFFAVQVAVKGTVRNTVIAVLTFCLWFGLLETVKMFLNGRVFLSEYEFVETMAGNTVWAYAPRAACVLVVDILQAVCVLWLLIQAADAGQRTVKEKVRAIGAGWLTVLCFAVSYFLTKYIYIWLLAEYVQGFGKSRTVVTYLTKVMLLAALAGLAMFPSFLFMLRKVRKMIPTTGSDAAQTQGVAKGTAAGGDKAGGLFKNRLVTAVVFAAIPVVGIVTLKIVGSSLEYDNSEYVLNDIVWSLDDMEYRNLYNDYYGILRDLNNLEAVVDGWKAYINEDTETLEKLRNEYPDLGQVEILLDYAQAADGDNLDDIQRRILDLLNETPDAANLNFAYLRLIPKDMDANGAAKFDDDEVRSYIVNRLIAADYYRHENVTPYDLSEKDLERIEDSLDGDIVTIARERYMNAQMKAELLETNELLGKGYDDGVFKMLQYAEENPDNFAVQKTAIEMAVSAYAGYRKDVRTSSKNLGEEVVEPAKRFDELSEKFLEYADGLSDDEKNAIREAVKIDIATLLYECRQLDSMEEYLKEAVRKVDSQQLSDFLMLAAIYNRDYETARPLLDANLKEYPDEMGFVSLQAILSYREGNIDQSLEAAVKLAELAVREDADPKAGAELLAIVDTYVCGDHTLQNGGDTRELRGRRIYPDKLTEEQKQIIAKSELLSTLLASEDIYERGGTILATPQWRDQYGDAEQKLEAIVAKYPKLSATYYILGKFYGNYSDGDRYDTGFINLDKAEAMYKKCLEIDDQQPVVWFTLGGFYDHVGKYEESYQCNEIVMELTAYGHYGIFMGDDNYGYGIVPHAEVTLDALRQRAESQK